MTIPRGQVMDKVVALTKRRGFIFPSSEIYGGLSGFYEYGPYGVLPMFDRLVSIPSLALWNHKQPRGLGGCRTAA